MSSGTRSWTTGDKTVILVEGATAEPQMPGFDGAGRDLQTCVGDDAFDLVCVGLAFRRLLEGDDAAVPTGQLNADIAEAGHPFADVGEGIERRLVTQELG